MRRGLAQRLQQAAGWRRFLIRRQHRRANLEIDAAVVDGRAAGGQGRQGGDVLVGEVSGTVSHHRQPAFDARHRELAVQTKGLIDGGVRAGQCEHVVAADCAGRNCQGQLYLIAGQYGF